MSDDEINVEEIMHTIRENVRKRKQSEKNLKVPDNQVGRLPLTPRDQVDQVESRQSDIDALNSQWDIRNITYTIISHRPFYGRMLVKGRQLVNGEVRRYVDPVIGNQSRFNKRIAQIFTQYEKRTSNLEESLDQLKNDSIKEDKDLRFLITGLEKRQEQISTQLKQILSEIADNHNTTIDLNKKLNQIIEKHLLNDQEVVEKKINTILSNLELVITNKLRIPIIEEPESRDYFAFEEHFRGPEKIIKERQRRYLPFFENCLNVLDIGCGRGEFLELLKENDIYGRGIDNNQTMVEYCQSKGFDAIHADAFLYLSTLDDDTLDGIFADQIIEHCTPDYLIRLLHVASLKLKSDSNIVLGTVNILNPGGLTNFFVDPTHITPIHPEYLKYCLEISGFKNIQIIFRTYDERENNESPESLQPIAADYVMIGKK